MNAPSTATRDLRGGHREPQASLEVALKHLPRICPHRPIQVAIRRQKCTNRPRAIAVAQMPETMQRASLSLGMIRREHALERLQHGVLHPRVLWLLVWVPVAAIVVIRDRVPEHVGATSNAIGSALQHVLVQVWNREYAPPTRRPCNVGIPELIEKRCVTSRAENVIQALRYLHRRVLLEKLRCVR